jgi:hypothetical protein
MTGLGWRPNASGTVLPLENLPIESALAPLGGPFSIDALIDCQIEREDPTRTIPNPERRALDKEIRAARVDLARLERSAARAPALRSAAQRSSLPPDIRSTPLPEGNRDQKCLIKSVLSNECLPNSLPSAVQSCKRPNSVSAIASLRNAAGRQSTPPRPSSGFLWVSFAPN